MSQSKIIQQIFVYGSLMSHFDNPMAFYLAQHTQLVGQGRINADLYDAGEFPCAVLDGESQYAVQGEIYAINPGSYSGLVEFLDRYEGFHESDPKNSLFVRTALPVHIAKGQELDCWAYVFNQGTDGMPKIKSGDWVGYLKEQGKQIY